MPSNPEKEKHLARKYVHQIIETTLERFEEGLPLKEIIRQSILNFAVSPLTIKKFIIEYYVELNYCSLDEKGILHKLTPEVKPEVKKKKKEVKK